MVVAVRRVTVIGFDHDTIGIEIVLADNERERDRSNRVVERRLTWNHRLLDRL